jgi:hypothetical protein
MIRAPLRNRKKSAATTNSMDEETEKMIRENNPFGDDFLRDIARSAPPARIESQAKSEQKKGGRNGDAQADRLVDFVLGDPTITLFHDDYGIPQVRLSIDGHYEVWPVGSSSFKLWLVKSFYDANNKKALGQNVLSTALQVIAGRARFDNEKIPLHTRAAFLGDAVWYDLADDEWRAVKITAEGWSVMNEPPILFKRQQHQASQVEPTTGGDVRGILRFFNIADKDQKMLFLVLLISYFIPGFPHPIAYVFGPQGSAKSTLSKILRKLVDPSRTEVLNMPKDNQELAQVLSHHYLNFFDNVSHISSSVADLLCRAVTGSGFSKRQLYTDDEDIIYTVQANIGINGINLASNKPDLLERSILFELPRVEKGGRRQERELLTEFENERPVILGAIFDAIAKALALKPAITESELPRMADFALWGCAIAEAIGYEREVFLKAYFSNIDSQNDEVLSEHPEATLLLSFMEGQDEWSGSSSSLLSIIKGKASEMDIAEAELPKSANALSRKLNTLKTNLEEVGIRITRNKGTRRVLTIRRLSANIADTADATQSAMASQPGKDGTLDDMLWDAVPESSAPKAQETSQKDGTDDTDDIFHDF